MSVQGFGYLVEAAMNALEGVKHLPEHEEKNSPKCNYGEQENDANEALHHEKRLLQGAEFTPVGRDAHLS